jgi:hypothetical protein
MSTITTRAGKGSQLTWTEVDTNFTNLNTDKIQSTNAGTTGQILTKTASAAEWATPASGGGSPFVIITMNSGTFQTVSGEVRRGILTETVDTAGIATLPTSYTFTLTAGTYLIQWPVNTSTQGAQVSLFNVTDSTTLFTGLYQITAVNYFTLSGTKTLDMRWTNNGFQPNSGNSYITKVA